MGNQDRLSSDLTAGWKELLAATPVIGANFPMQEAAPTYAWWRGCCGPPDAIDTQILTTRSAVQQ